MKRLAFLLAILIFCLILASCGRGADIVIHTAAPSASSETEKAETTVNENDGISVVINKSSMTFHFQNCPYIHSMAEKNRMDITVDSVEYLLQHGYAPCGGCAAEYKNKNSEETTK